MKLKELFMQVTYDEIEPAIEKVYNLFRSEVNQTTKDAWKKMFATLQNMEPETGDMKLTVAPGDASGYYDEETLSQHPEYENYLYSIWSKPWRQWLGMEVDEDTLKNMSVADILGNCIYEMSWGGYDEDHIQTKHEELFGQIQDSIAENENLKEENVEVDAKTQCLNFVKSFIPEVFPSIVENIDNPKFEQELKEANCEENGAFCVPINLKVFGMPLTGIAFFYIYINGSCLMGVSSEIEGEYVEIMYNWFAPTMKELKSMVKTEEAQNSIVYILSEQVEKYFDA